MINTLQKAPFIAFFFVTHLSNIQTLATISTFGKEKNLIKYFLDTYSLQWERGLLETVREKRSYLWIHFPQISTVLFLDDKISGDLFVVFFSTF